MGALLIMLFFVKGDNKNRKYRRKKVLGMDYFNKWVRNKKIKKIIRNI